MRTLLVFHIPLNSRKSNTPSQLAMNEQYLGFVFEMADTIRLWREDASRAWVLCGIRPEQRRPEFPGRLQARRLRSRKKMAGAGWLAKHRDPCSVAHSSVVSPLLLLPGSMLVALATPCLAPRNLLQLIHDLWALDWSKEVKSFRADHQRLRWPSSCPVVLVVLAPVTTKVPPSTPPQRSL